MANNESQTDLHVIFAVNPKAGVGPNVGVVERAIAAIEAKGFTVESYTDLDKMMARSHQLASEGKLRTVIAAGGDGTIALLANMLPREVPISILPLGTQNLLAKYFSITLDAEKLADRIADGTPMKFDSGLANGKRFLVVASCGFDAEVVAQFAHQRTGHTSYVSWAKSIWATIWKYRYPEIRVYVDDAVEPMITKWAFTFNFPCYAMGLPIAPLANADDGLLDFVTFRGGGFWNGLFYLASILFRSQRGWRDIAHTTVTKVRIESDKPAPFQLDGDPGGQLPLEIEMERESLTLLLVEKP